MFISSMYITVISKTFWIVHKMLKCRSDCNGSLQMDSSLTPNSELRLAVGSLLRKRFEDSFVFSAKAFAYGGSGCCQDSMQFAKNGKHSEDGHADKRAPVGIDYVRRSVIVEVCQRARSHWLFLTGSPV